MIQHIKFSEADGYYYGFCEGCHGGASIRIASNDVAIFIAEFEKLHEDHIPRE